LSTAGSIRDGRACRRRAAFPVMSVNTEGFCGHVNQRYQENGEQKYLLRKRAS
jgi:hypothetical protein